MPFFVYLLECRDGSLYCGMTNNLARRLDAHNSGIASKYTRARRPVKLVYSKAVATKSEALKLEAAIKQWPRRAKCDLIRSKPIQ